MSCSACVGHVSRALSSLPGTSDVTVDLESGQATLNADSAKVTIADLIAAVDEEGYSATPLESA